MSMTRRAEAYQSATRLKLSTIQEIAIWTWAKAAASCVTSPRVSSPRRYFGAANSSGTSGVIGPIVLVIQVRRPCCWTISSQRWTTVP